MSEIDTAKIFNGQGLPKETYVPQEHGRFEKELIEGLHAAGTLCLLTGSSKTGKTTLYNTVLGSAKLVPLRVGCAGNMTADEFWKKPLEILDFSRLTSRQSAESSQTQTEGKISGELNWVWLAKLIGETKLGTARSDSESDIREKVLASPSCHHLIPLLKHSNTILVIDNFHYLSKETQIIVFQQLKDVCEAEISVIVISTTHRGADLAHANPDLPGRIRHIELRRWSDADLTKIAEKGFSKLKVKFDSTVFDAIARECAGLPIVMQQTCAQLFADRGMQLVRPGSEVEFSAQDGWSALHKVAVSRYREFESWYKRLTRGPKKDLKRDETYSLILSAFAKNPQKFDLTRDEICERLDGSRIGSKSQTEKLIEKTLDGLKEFQQSYGIELLEWSAQDDSVYVIEPSFLFYVRWRNAAGRQPDPVEDTISKLRSSRR